MGWYYDRRGKTRKNNKQKANLERCDPDRKRGVFTGDTKMTKYEYLQNKAIECYNKAGKINDVNLKKFYFNASEGYKMKAAKLTVEEAGERI